MSLARPKVLVVLPTLGERLSLLERALRSVDAQRNDVDITLAVVVPRSRQDARALAKKYGATLIDDPGRGMSAAMNAGLAARGVEDFCIWLGDDDFYLPGGILTLAQLFNGHHDAVVAYGACDYVNDAGKLLWTSKAGHLATSLLGFGPNLIPHPAALIRLDALQGIGGYKEALRYAMDLDVFLTLRSRGAFLSTTTSVSAFGWQPDSLTVSDRNASAVEARGVKRSHLPAWLRVAEPLWAYPVNWASRLAAHRISKKASLGNNS